MRRLAILLVAVGGSVVMATTGYGSSSYSSRDLAAIVDPKPTLSNWSFEEGDPYLYPIPAHPPAFTLREWLGESPTKARKAFANKLKKGGFRVGRHTVWDGDNGQDPGGSDADAVVFAFLFRDATGAGVGFQALRAGAKGFTRSLPTKGLGEESLGQYDNAIDEVTAYLWRRGNLVVLAQVVCDTECGFAVVPPSRAYAGQIDGRAKQKS
jgi:hypothetical protein